MPTAPASTASETARRRQYDADGLVPAIVQERGTGEVLMMAWMNAETLRTTLDEGRTVFWSRSRQEVWRKGDTSGDRQYVREAYYDCDGDTLLFVVEQEGEGACHTGAHIVLLPPLRRLTRELDCASGRAASEFRALAARVHRRARCGASCWPTSRRRSPRSPSSSATATGLPARVGRARRALEPVVVRRPRPGGHARRCATARSTVDGDAARRRAARPGHARRASRRCSTATGRPPLADLPPLHGGLVGYLGYDVVREVERLPDVPARRPAAARRRACRVIGELAAFDHWRQRVT